MDTKKILIVAGIVLALLLAAGGTLLVLSRNQDDDTIPSDEPSNNVDDNSNKITLTYWGLWEEAGTMQPIIDKYEEANPNVEIEYIKKSFSQYETILPNQLNQPVNLDIVRIHNTWVPKLEQYLYPMPSSVMTPSEFGETFYPVNEKTSTGSDGNLYTLPMNIDGLMLFYNKDLFNQEGIDNPPTDWDEFTQYAQKLTKKSNGEITQAGAGIGSLNNVRHGDEIISQMMLQNNTDFIEDGKISISDNDDFEFTLEAYTKYITEYEVWNDGFKDDLEMFSKGELAMFFGPSWRVFNINEYNSNLNYGLAPVPSITGGTEQTQTHLATYWTEAVSANSAHPEQAWDFLNFMNQPENLRTTYEYITENVRAFGEPYPRVEMAPEISDAPYVKTLIEIAPNLDQLDLLDKETQKALYNPLIEDLLQSSSLSTTILNDTEDNINEQIQDYSY